MGSLPWLSRAIFAIGSDRADLRNQLLEGGLLFPGHGRVVKSPALLLAEHFQDVARAGTPPSE